MRKHSYFFFLLLSAILAANFCIAQKIDWKKVKVLVYTKNGKGYVHENIPAAVACIKRMGLENGFSVEASDNPSVFTEGNLKKYTVLIFASTNNDVFDSDEQRLAFRKYIEAGGGFVGIHSIVGTERNWKWFKTMIGGTFVWHPKFQRYRLAVTDTSHPSAQGIPVSWEKEDECYFTKEMYPGIQTIMAHDITSLDSADKEKIKTMAGPFTELYPAVWTQQYDGGTIWITALGHDKKDYEDPIFVKHVFNGILFVGGKSRNMDFSKAYATSRDEAVK